MMCSNNVVPRLRKDQVIKQQLILSVVMPLLFAGLAQPVRAEKLLQGGVTFTEQVAPVSPDPTPGNISSTNPNSVSVRQWVRIPPWLAGFWEADDSTQFYEKDWKTGIISKSNKRINNQTTGGFGTLQDNRGGIWQLVYYPFTTTDVQDGMSVMNTAEKFEIDSATDKKVVTRVLNLAVFVRPNTFKIQRIYRTENICIYTPAKKNKINVEQWTRVYGPDGRAWRDVKNRGIRRLVGPFKPQTRDGARNLVEEFRAFLVQSGNGQLAP